MLYLLFAADYRCVLSLWLFPLLSLLSCLFFILFHKIFSQMYVVGSKGLKSLYMYLVIPLTFNPPTEGLSWDDLRKIQRCCQRMA